MKKIVNLSLRCALVAAAINISSIGLRPNQKEVGNFKKGSYNKKFFRGIKK